jgi:hypothetical protein
VSRPDFRAILLYSSIYIVEVKRKIMKETPHSIQPALISGIGIAIKSSINYSGSAGELAEKRTTVIGEKFRR